MGMEVGRIPWLALAGTLALATGCRQEQITHYRVAKQAPPVEATAAADPGGMAPAHGAPAPAPTPQGGSMAGQVPPPPTPTDASALRWTLPKGWTESLSGGGMRYATLKPPAVAGQASTSRWWCSPARPAASWPTSTAGAARSGSRAIDDAELARARTTVRSKAGPVNVYDFTSEGDQAEPHGGRPHPPSTATPGS